MADETKTIEEHKVDGIFDGHRVDKPILRAAYQHMFDTNWLSTPENFIVTPVYYDYDKDVRVVTDRNVDNFPEPIYIEKVQIDLSTEYFNWLMALVTVATMTTAVWQNQKLLELYSLFPGWYLRVAKVLSYSSALGVCFYKLIDMCQWRTTFYYCPHQVTALLDSYDESMNIKLFLGSLTTRLKQTSRLNIPDVSKLYLKRGTIAVVNAIVKTRNFVPRVVVDRFPELLSSSLVVA